MLDDARLSVGAWVDCVEGVHPAERRVELRED